MRSTSPFLFAALCSLPLCAQEKADPWRFVPADATVVARIPSPAKCRTVFAGTSLEKLWSSTTGRKLLSQVQDAMDAGMAEARSENPLAADFLEAIANEWTGDLVIGLRMDLGAAVLAADFEPPPFAISVALTSDGKLDFAPHAAALVELMEEDVPEQKLDLQAGGHTFRSVLGPDGIGFTFPQVVDGHLVMCIGNDLEQDLAGLVGSESRFEPSGGAGASGFSFHVSAAGFTDGLKAAMGDSLEEMPFDVGKLFSAFGLDALKDLDVRVGAEGQRVVVDMSLSLGAGPRGILGVISSEPVDRRLLRLVPADAEAFNVGAFPVGKFVDWIGSIVDEMSPVIGVDWKGAQDAFAEECKVRLVEDLVAHVGSSLLTLQDVKAQAEHLAEDEDADEFSSALAGTCVAMELRDGKAFGANLEKLLRSRGLHAARKSEDYQGTKVYRLNIAGLAEIEYAVTDDLLLLAGGKSESGRRSLRSVLDQRAQPMDGELPAALTAKVSQFAEGWTGFGVVGIADFLDMVAQAAGQAPPARQGQSRSTPSPAQDIAAGFRGLGTELRRLDLDLLLSATYATKDRISVRYLW